MRMATETAPGKGGLSFHPIFTQGKNPYTEIEWEKRDIRVKDWETGAIIFSQDAFRVPANWSDNAGQIVASKYAFGPEWKRESGVDAVVGRVVKSITNWGENHGYFASERDARTFHRELAHLCLHQYGAFNSPVWFNVGIHETRGLEGSGTVWHWNEGALGDYGVLGAAKKTTQSYVYPQTSACFIQGVEDTMESLMSLAVSEAMLFKHGSGTGTDFSTIRSKRERLSTGGVPSGPISFMRIYDRIAATIKSGGKTRRAAKMQTLLASHGDIMEFIHAKGREERKAHMLIAAGMDNSFNSEAYDTVAFQNANFSVRYTANFMTSLTLSDSEEQSWPLQAVTTQEVLEWINPHVIWDAMAEETWRCGDPGAQFVDTINAWHTCPFSVNGEEMRPINSSNPCSEYLFQDDSACNLASLRLTRFVENGVFRTDLFKQAIRVFIVAQEILIDMGSYPTEAICRNQHDFRTLGLGFADLGGLLMGMGLPYDSDEGRAFAGCVSALMTAHGYCVSAEMAAQFGAFEGFQANREPMLTVIGKHVKTIMELGDDVTWGMNNKLYPLWNEALDAWILAEKGGLLHGYRNAQISVIAPTGTIAFMMDCSTTGIEPPLGLVVYKTLAGGGNMIVVNAAVVSGLVALGYERHYSSSLVEVLLETVERDGHLADSALLKPEHLAVFDCALAAPGSTRTISWEGHLNMMATVQPFISGAISKTVNVPESFTAQQIADVYYQAWRKGLKCVAIYRDRSKKSQPITLDKPVILADEAAWGAAVDSEAGVCCSCSAPFLVVAGTCSVCPLCGASQGGCL